MPGEMEKFMPVESTPVEASFVVINEDDTFALDNDNRDNNDNMNNNGSEPSTIRGGDIARPEETIPTSPPLNQMAPLSISQGTTPGSERLLNKRLSSQSSLTMSIDQIRSSLMLHATEINPEIIIDRLANLLGENRKLRAAVKQHNENLERATLIIVKLKKDKSELKESGKKNFVRTKKYVEKLKADLAEKGNALAMVETEVAELKRFRIDAANWQQQYESTQKLLQVQEEEFKTHRLKLKELELEQEEEEEAALTSKRASTTSMSSEPSTPSSNETYLEMVARVSDVEQENMALESRMEEALDRKAEFETKWLESDTKLRRVTAREKQSEQEALGLRDTIEAHKSEIEILRKNLTFLKSENQNLVEDSNVKDLMDEAQRKISSITLRDEEEEATKGVAMRGKKSGEEAFVYDSYVGGVGERSGEGIAVERKSFMEALERSQEQQKKMEEALEQMKKQMAEHSQDVDKEVEERVRERLKAELANMSPSRSVARSESHPPQHVVNNNSKEMTSMRQQVISLVEELRQSQKILQDSKSAGEKTEQQYKMLKTQMEMEETKITSQLTMLRQALVDSDSQLQREKTEVERTQALLMDAQRELEEREGLLRYLNPSSGSGNSLVADQERDRLRMEIDRLTAMQFTAEDAISQKDSELSKARQEMAKLRKKLDDNSMLQAQVQVYKEDFNQERHMREVMAQEKEKVLRENQQLQDQISTLNDTLQPQGGRYPDLMLQQPGGRNVEPRLRSNTTQHHQSLSHMARSVTPRNAVPSAQAPSAGNNPRHYQNQHNLQQQQLRQYQQQQTRGFAGGQQQYPLDDREAASLMGRHLLGDVSALSCPFQGIENASAGAFFAANIPYVQGDGASASPAPPHAASASPTALQSKNPKPPSVADRTRSPSINVTGINLPPARDSSPAPNLGVLVPKCPKPPTAPSASKGGELNQTTPTTTSSENPTGLSTSTSMTQSMEEEDWQIEFGTCPKCQLKFYNLEMLQMHVIECLDMDADE